ncbi:Cloroperoxidase [Serendipita vermifera]|nr:Cloroperoxidase [Serendipita vermifera]
MFNTINSLVRLSLGLSILSAQNTLHLLKNLYWTLYTQIWDVNLHIANIFAPELNPNRVIPQGKPGANGDWSRFTYLPPTENDSRSPCPALNALCNVGILPRDGRNIKFTDFAKILNETYNLSPSLCMSILMSIARLFGKDYFTDSVDLELFNTHNVIEHDASLIRHDAIIQPDQGRPAVDLVNMLLRFATGAAVVNKQRVRILTPADIAAFTRQRRADCKAHNPQYTLKFLHKFFSANNSAIMYDTFAGRVDDLKVWLTEERFPQGWQPRYNKRYGYTLLALNWRTLQIALWAEPPPFVVPPRRPVTNGPYSD